MKKRTLAGNARPLYSSPREFCCWKEQDGTVTAIHHTEGARTLDMATYNTLRSSGWLPRLIDKPADGKPIFNL